MLKLYRRLGLTLAFVIFLLIGAACQAALPGKKASVSSSEIASHPIFALSVADACIITLDARGQQVTGTIRNPQFNASTDLALTSDGNLFITIDADADHDYREILLLDPASGDEISRITVPWAPVKLGISATDRLLVGHTLEKSSNGRFDLSIIDGAKRKLIKEIELDGYVADIIFDGDIAYIAQVAVRPDRDSGILIYDVAKLQQIAFYPIPQPAAGQPPLSPASIALKNQDALYITLFQFEENAPCQQKGHLVLMDLHTGDLTPIIDLDDVGPMLMTSQGRILTGESCGAVQGRLLLIDPEAKSIIQQSVAGPGIYDFAKLENDMVAVSVSEENAVVFYDAKAGQVKKKLSLPCIWPGALAAP